MSESNVEIVRRGYELFASGDMEGAAGLFAAEAELADAGGIGVTGTATGTRRGPEGFLESVADTAEVFDDFHVEVGNMIDAGDAVAVQVRVTGRGRASGAVQEVDLVHLWILRDGKVIRGEVYRTTEEALEAARQTN